MRFSLSLLLILCPGVFSLTSSATTTSKPAVTSSVPCNSDDCLKQILATPTKAAPYCATYTVTVNTVSTAFPTYISSCNGSKSKISSACSCLASISKLSTIKPLPITRPSSVYTPPPVPTAYTGCLLDPTNTNLSFRLLDPQFGIPIINNSSLAQKASQVITPAPEFRFVKTGTAGLYDLKLGNLFLAADLTGRAVFVSASTGSKYVTKDGKTYITSLFSYDCQGALQIGIAGLVPFQMGYLSNDNQLYLQPNRNLYNPTTTTRKVRRDSEITKRAINDHMRLNIAKTTYRSTLRVSTPVVAPASTYTIDASERSASRCANLPMGLQVFDKPGARPIEVNACGSSGPSKLVPNLIFKSSCDSHDSCFDTCNKDFAPCNDAFENDTKQACFAKYPNTSSSSALNRWSCVLTAEFYAWNVRQGGGKDAFASATRDRCECRCPTGEKECNQKCIPVLTDPENCGACGVKCSGKCIGGKCAAIPTTTTSAAPAPTDPCNPLNFYQFTGANIIQLVNDNMMWTITMPFEHFLLQSRAESGIYDKVQCCRECHAGLDCFAYAVAPSGVFKDNPFPSYCTRFFPRKSTGYGSIRLPKTKAECPKGGLNLTFNGRGEAGVMSLEPGPCAYNRDLGVGTS